jgi:glutathione peroxidase
MNGIAEKFGDKVGVVGFNCNQFGHQSNENDDETLNALKYVRPGNGFEPKFEVMAKVHVNGANSHPLFKWMREAVPIPQDPAGDTNELGCDDNHALILPRGGFDQTTVTLWSPVTRTDIAWNFEKFLIDANGNIVRRYSRFFPTASISKDIEALLSA